jgi:hypothetical protein
MAKFQKSIDILFFTYHGLLGAAFGILLLLIGNGICPQIAWLRDLLNSLGSTLVAGSIFGQLYTYVSTKNHFEELKYLVEREESGFRKIYQDASLPEFFAEIKNRILGAKEIKFYGVAFLGLLGVEEIRNKLQATTQNSQTKVTILLADSDSPQVKQRIDDEDEDIVSEIGVKNIQKVVKKMKEIENAIGNIELFKVKLFKCYPTYALIIIDDNIYSYPYGYKRIGSKSPVTHLKGFDSPQSQFYRDQFDRILMDVNENKK